MIKIKNFVSLLFAAAIWVGAPTSPMTVAHRGAPDLAPENTAESFAGAAAQGVDAIECDLRLTADGVLVCHHDDTTGRVWDEDLTVSETTLGKLQSLGLSNGFRVAFPKSRSARIPTFAEGVAAMGNARIFAELKGGGTAVAEALCAESERMGIKERLTVISYDREAIEYMHERGYDCALLMSCSGPTELLSADIPVGVSVDVNYGALSAKAVDELHARGVKVYCYTVEGERGYSSLSRLGVDGVTGDNFAFLKE